MRLEVVDTFVPTTWRTHHHVFLRAALVCVVEHLALAFEILVVLFTDRHALELAARGVELAEHRDKTCTNAQYVTAWLIVFTARAVVEISHVHRVSDSVVEHHSRKLRIVNCQLRVVVLQCAQLIIFDKFCEQPCATQAVTSVVKLCADALDTVLHERLQDFNRCCHVDVGDEYFATIAETTGCDDVSEQCRCVDVLAAEKCETCDVRQAVNRETAIRVGEIGQIAERDACHRRR